MKKILCLVVCLSLLLCGCDSLFDDSYTSVTPYTEKITEEEGLQNDAANFQELCSALLSLISAYRSTGIISVPNYNQATLVQDMREAIAYVQSETPLGAYAVENITLSLGTSNGKTALSAEIRYSKASSQINSIRKVANLAVAYETLGKSLTSLESGILLLIQDYKPFDVSQWVADYCALHPDIIIEAPTVTVNTYPDLGSSRLLEIQFNYQTDRSTLRNMQNTLRPVFDSATVYVSEDNDPHQQYEKLFSFLNELLLDHFVYKPEDSLTPIYTLLENGIGNSRAIAMTYATMCRNAGLECITVSGTKNGTLWNWNIIQINGISYHVDLLDSRDAKQLCLLSDDQMQGYVWDYSQYPACISTPNS